MKKMIMAASLLLATAAMNDGLAQNKSITSTDGKGTQILGDTDIRVKAQNVRTLATGKNNKASTNVGAIGKSTQILGDTSIKVDAKNSTTRAYGTDNAASSNVGTIGNTN